jgi:hypothetical protein
MNSRGKTHFLSLLGARNIMYQDIYWHKTVRACGIMFKSLFYQLVETGHISTSEIKDLLLLTDDSFIHQLMSKSRASGVKELIELGEVFEYGDRRIFKQVFIYSTKNIGQSLAGTKRFFNDFLLPRPSLGRCLERGATLGRHLAKTLGRKVPFRLLVEVTPVKKGRDLFDVTSSRMWNLREKTFEPLPFDLEALDGFLGRHQHAYIFAHPDDEEALKRLSISDWNKAFSSIN